MRRWSPWEKNDDGTAALEFITIGLILLVPLAYLVLTLGAVQQTMLGAEAAARHTARVIAQAKNADAAARSGDSVLTSVVDEYGMNAQNVGISVTCTPAGSVCPAAGATVIVRIETYVSLPFVPSIFGLDRATRIPLHAAAAQKVSRSWGAE